MTDYVVVQYLEYFLRFYTDEESIGDPYDLFTSMDKAAVERAIQIVKEYIESNKAVKEG